MNKSQKSAIIYLIIILLPLFEITEYFYNYISKSDSQFAAYSLIIIYLLLFLIATNKIRIILIFILLYYFLYILLPPTPWNNNASQTIPFVLTIALLITFSYNEIVFSKKYVNYLFIFTLFYITLFFVSAELNGLTKIENRLYLNGFVISHAFSYSIIALGLFIYKYKNKALGFIFMCLSVLVGARSGLVLFLLTLAYIYYENIISKRINVLSALTFIIFILMISLNNPVLDSTLDTFKGLDWTNINLFGNDKYSAAFTASRSFIWNSTLFEVSQKFSTIELIFGRGPLAPFEFSESLGLGRIWLHNDFFNILYAYGIFGLILYVSLLIKFYFKTKNIYVLAYIFIAAFINGFYYYDTPLILTILTLIASKNIN